MLVLRGTENQVELSSGGSSQFEQIADKHPGRQTENRGPIVRVTATKSASIVLGSNEAGLKSWLNPMGETPWVVNAFFIWVRNEWKDTARLFQISARSRLEKTAGYSSAGEREVSTPTLFDIVAAEQGEEITQ